MGDLLQRYSRAAATRQLESALTAAEGAGGPRIVTNEGGASADVYIYGTISRWDINAKDFAAQLAAITASTINVFINSPGGSVFEGLAILNGLRRHSATVRVTVDGIAASAASFIAMAGDEIVMSPNSQLMIHDGLMLLDILALANPEDIARILAELEKMRGELERQSDNIAAIYAGAAAKRGSKAVAADWRALMRAETWYFAEEAVEAGLADRVDGDASDDPEAAAKEEPAARGDQLVAVQFKYRGRGDAGPPAAPAAATEDVAVEQPAAKAQTPLDWNAAAFAEMTKEAVG